MLFKQKVFLTVYVLLRVYIMSWTEINSKISTCKVEDTNRRKQFNELNPNNLTTLAPIQLAIHTNNLTVTGNAIKTDTDFAYQALLKNSFAMCISLLRVSLKLPLNPI